MELFRETLGYPERLGIAIHYIGESAVAFDFLNYDFMIGFNVEGLGTKNAVADDMYEVMVKNGYPNPEKVYERIGQCTAMMSIMDLVGIGADPFGYGDFLTAGDNNYFNDAARNRAILSGFGVTAKAAGFAIPCGETPVLRDVVNPKHLVLEGASIGLIKPKSRLSVGDKIKPGDIIYGLPSHGLAANGLTAVRDLAAKLPEGYFTRMPSGIQFGGAVLVPTPNYVRPIIEMFDKANLHYVSPITGHGWEKVGRARYPFTYVVEKLSEPPEVFEFLIEEGKRHFDPDDFTDRKNYYRWNMGTFVTLIAPPWFRVELI